MLRNKLVRSDGSVIDSSVIISCEFTEEVNSGENLTVGDVTSSEINLEILSTDMVEQGETLTYYMIEDDVEKLIGVFNAEKPTVASRTSVRFSAYDNIVKSEKIFSGWLRDNQGLFPMTLGELVGHTCVYCGLTLATPAFPQSDIEINAFYADGITCREILSWASAMAGRFVRANSNGDIEFAWYADTATYAIAPSGASMVNVTDDGKGNISITGDEATVTDDGNGNVVVDMPSLKTTYSNGVVSLIGVTLPYKQGGLSYEAYTTDVIERVQIKRTDDDIGVIYPGDVTGNCFVINGNMLLSTCSTEDITKVAMSLYGQLRTISYVPAKVTLPRTIVIRAGDILAIQDPNGVEISTYVMKVSVTPSGTNIESTGNKSYETNAAVSSEKYTNLAGKVLEIKKTVDGISVSNKDLAGRIGTLELSTEAFKTYVGETFVSEDEFGRYQESISTQYEQTKESFEWSFNQTKTDLNNLAGEVQAQHDERTSYIRFEDGNIVLGRADSDILLIIKNDRISFVRNVTNQPEVAWFAKDVLHVTDGEFTTQLMIGKFAFQPGVRGNLSFKKVVK